MAKKAKPGLKQKLEKAYAEMKGKSAEEREARAPKGGCKCGGK